MVDKFPFGKAPFWLFAIAVCSTALAVGVRGEQPQRADLVMVTFTEAHFKEYQRAIPRFEKKHQVNVELQFADWGSLQRRLQNAMLAGVDVPDVVEMMESSLGFFTRGPEKDFGFLDLTERVEAENLRQRMVSSRFALWMARGRIYGIPHDVHPMMLAYRRDIIEKLGINEADIIAYDVDMAALFDEALRHSPEHAQALANWLTAEVVGLLAADGRSLSATRIPAGGLAKLVAMVEDGRLSGRAAKELLPEVITGSDPLELVSARGLEQVSDESALLAVVDDVLAANPQLVERVKVNPKALNALLGEVMRATRGTAKADVVRNLLEQRLDA